MASPVYCKGMLLLAFALLCRTVPVTRADDLEAREPSLVLYLFEQYVTVPQAEVTNIIASPPDGNILNMVWGNLGVVDFPVRASPKPSAPIIGRSPAFFFPNKKLNNLSSLKFITINTKKYKGTIFAVSDFMDFLLDDHDGSVEFSVSGGTGSFRDASGYITVTVTDIAVDHVTYKYAVYLSTCKRAPLMFSLDLQDE